MTGAGAVARLPLLWRYEAIYCSGRHSAIINLCKQVSLGVRGGQEAWPRLCGRIPDELPAMRDLELLEDLVQMHLHGANADEELLGDFSVRVALGDLGDDFALPRGETLGEFLAFRLTPEEVINDLPHRRGLDTGRVLLEPVGEQAEEALPHGFIGEPLLLASAIFLPPLVDDLRRCHGAPFARCSPRPPSQRWRSGRGRRVLMVAPVIGTTPLDISRSDHIPESI